VSAARPAAWAAAALAATALAAAAPRAAADPAAPYAPPARAAHLARALTALAALGPTGVVALEAELHAGVRARCRPTAGRPPSTPCLIDVARARCERPQAPAACAAAADALLTLQRAELDLLDERTRARLVVTSTDYHAAVLAELRARFALLAAELAIAAPEVGDAIADRHAIAATAAAIDRFCAARDRVARTCPSGAALCVPSVAWQRCAAGLLWYLGTATPGARP
jgi:hypothetical protein